VNKVDGSGDNTLSWTEKGTSREQQCSEYNCNTGLSIRLGAVTWHPPGKRLPTVEAF
jgi:hypothetical protein